jgi:hypothetical protein
MDGTNMSHEPLRKKFAKKADNGFAATAFVLGGMLAAGGTTFAVMDGDVDMEHSAQREEVLQVFDQRLDRLENLMEQNTALQQQFDMAALNNDIGKRNSLSQQIEQNTRSIRWLSQEYASVLLKTDAINEEDFRTVAERFQKSGFDKQTAIIIDPDFAEWRNEARAALPLNPKFQDFVAMSKDMRDRNDNQFGASGFIGFFSAFPMLIVLMGVGSLMENWKRLPNLPDKPEKPSRLKTLVGRGRKHNH